MPPVPSVLLEGHLAKQAIGEWEAVPAKISQQFRATFPKFTALMLNAVWWKNTFRVEVFNEQDDLIEVDRQERFYVWGEQCWSSSTITIGRDAPLADAGMDVFNSELGRIFVYNKYIQYLGYEATEKDSFGMCNAIDQVMLEECEMDGEQPVRLFPYENSLLLACGYESAMFVLNREDGRVYLLEDIDGTSWSAIGCKPEPVDFGYCATRCDEIRTAVDFYEHIATLTTNSMA